MRLTLPVRRVARSLLAFLRAIVDKPIARLLRGRVSLCGRVASTDNLGSAKIICDEHFESVSSPDHPCRDTLTVALSMLNGAPATIVETGSSAWGTNSSRLFDAYVSSNGGSFESVDIRLTPALGLSKDACARSRFYCDDSVSFLRSWSARNPGRQIDLLYLDSWDLDVCDPLPSALHGLAEFLVARRHLRSGSLLLIDDTPASFEEFAKAHGAESRMDFRRCVEDFGINPGKGALVHDFLTLHVSGRAIVQTYQLLWQC